MLDASRVAAPMQTRFGHTPGQPEQPEAPCRALESARFPPNRPSPGLFLDSTRFAISAAAADRARLSLTIRAARRATIVDRTRQMRTNDAATTHSTRRSENGPRCSTPLLHRERIEHGHRGRADSRTASATAVRRTNPAGDAPPPAVSTTAATRACAALRSATTGGLRGNPRPPVPSSRSRIDPFRFHTQQKVLEAISDA
jgi:hypothetical protein